MKNNTTKREEGLPEIAVTLRKKKPVVIAMIVLMAAVFIGVCFFTQSEKKPDQTIPETYTVQADKPIPIDNAKVVMTKPVASSVQAVQPKKELTEQQLAFVQEKAKELQQRLSAPLMAVSSTSAVSVSDAPANKLLAGSDRNTQFLNQVTALAPETEKAVLLGALNAVIAEGSLIHAILESATDSDLPGYVRAIVSEPIYSEDGTQILIPRGSRLIGQYKSGMLQGQSRIYIVWLRLITPEGVSLNLGSPGIDNIGMAGIAADDMNRHFWERFGTGSLLSMLGAGAANAGVSGADQDNSASAYRNAIANSFTQSANQSLEQDMRVAPTLKTFQGRPIMVFVARDLNFQTVIKQTKPRLNVF